MHSQYGAIFSGPDIYQFFGLLFHLIVELLDRQWPKSKLKNVVQIFGYLIIEIIFELLNFPILTCFSNFCPGIIDQA